MSIPKSHSSPEASSPADPRSRSPSGQKSRPGLFKRTPRDFVDMFIERWWLGAIAGGIAVAVIIVFRPHFEPLYRTETALQFETRRSNIVDMRPVTDPILQGLGELNLHIEELRSNNFAATALSSFTPEETALIQKPYTDPAHPEAAAPSLAQIVRPAITISPRRAPGVPILVISVTHRTPEAAALIAERFAQKYIDYQVDKSSTKTNSAMTFLQRRQEELRADVELAQANLLDYRQKHNINSLSENQSIIAQRLQSLSALLIKAENEQADSKHLITTVDDYRSKNRNLLELPQIIGSGPVSSFFRSLGELRSRRTLWSEEYGDELPKMKDLDREIIETQTRLDDAIEKTIRELRARYEQAEEALGNLRDSRLAAELEARTLDKISTDYRLLDDAAKQTSTQFNSISGRLNELKITMQLQDTNIQIFDHAWIPNAPADTGIAAVTMKASMAGLGLLFFIPLAIGLFDTRIRTPVHVEEGLQEPLLGAVKRMRKMGETQRAQVFRLQKEKDLAEAYLGIFSEIEVRSALGFPKTLMITSSVPAEGKSLLCSNLAAVFASHKRRTLLVDC
ncbi:MAG: exopolysaccharide transport family protein, partial [Opitutaceae bacterium]